MLWLLDTCVLSELTRTDPHPSVWRWIQVHGDSTVMSAVSVGEILDGIERMSLGRNRNRLQFWFEGLCHRYAEKTLATDVQVWRTYARLKASMAAIGQVQPDMELLIAACATVHGATVVTRNTKDFEATGVPLLNPWLIES
ncbi:MAG: hypothetical protein RLZZ612_1223 [Pseudomonadota bacterium]|jgi:predicted nucleic acid-binding protein